MSVGVEISVEGIRLLPDDATDLARRPSEKRTTKTSSPFGGSVESEPKSKLRDTLTLREACRAATHGGEFVDSSAQAVAASARDALVVTGGTSTRSQKVDGRRRSRDTIVRLSPIEWIIDRLGAPSICASSV